MGAKDTSLATLHEDETSVSPQHRPNSADTLVTFSEASPVETKAMLSKRDDVIVTALSTCNEPRMRARRRTCGTQLWRRVRLLALPLLALWSCLAFAIAWLVTFLVIPSALLAQRLYWACPFIPHIFRAMGPVRGNLLRVGFEASYCINVLTRFLTLPLRRQLPSLYVIGFPKCGTTSLAERLKQHPALSPPAGLPYHEALSKETHFFEGVLGQQCASQRWLYRSFFPTIMKQWWAEGFQGVEKHMTFDACPVHACLPYVAKRIAHLTPDAKIVIMVRDPVSGVFSAETMLSDMGVPLPWPSLSEPSVGPVDPRFKAGGLEEEDLWDRITNLGVHDPLPEQMPEALYTSLSGILRCGFYYQLIQPYLQEFPPDNIMIISFDDFVQDSEGVVEDVLRFVQADPALLPPRDAAAKPAMQNAYRGRKLHPSVAARLRVLYRPSIQQLQTLLGRDLHWGVRDMAAGSIVK